MFSCSLKANLQLDYLVVLGKLGTYVWIWFFEDIVNCCIMDLQSESILPSFVTTMTKTSTKKNNYDNNIYNLKYLFNHILIRFYIMMQTKLIQ